MVSNVPTYVLQKEVGTVPGSPWESISPGREAYRQAKTQFCHKALHPVTVAKSLSLLPKSTFPRRRICRFRGSQPSQQ